MFDADGFDVGTSFLIAQGFFFVCKVPGWVVVVVVVVVVLPVVACGLCAFYVCSFPCWSRCLYLFVVKISVFFLRSS